MRLIKPLRLSFIHRVFGHQKKQLMVTTVAACLPFDKPKAPVSETEMWKMAGTDLGRFGVLDYWMFKPEAEVLVTGSCYTGEREKGSDYVRLQLGAPDKRLVDKKLYVFGDRRWTLIGASEPDMFSRMPVDYAHAFGGEKYAHNPMGRGLVSLTDETGADYHPLPNVEEPKHLVKSKGDRPTPASFAPWDLTWPVHFEKKMGSYDKDWVQKNGFALADDVDFSLFNVAPPDQRCKEFFRGDENIRIENMHPEQRQLETTLPGYVGRCLVQFTRKYDPEEQLREVPLRLDTIHVFPHQERVVVMFRGVIEIQTTDATDVELVVAALEGPTPRPLEHFRKVIALRLDKERGALYSLRDADLMPADVEIGNAVGIKVGDPLDDVLQPENLLRENMNKRIVREQEKARTELLAAGVDPALIPPIKVPEPTPPVPNLEELPEFVDKLEADRVDAEKLANEKRAEAMKQLEAMCDEYKIDLPELEKQNKKDKTGPPKFSADEEMRKLEEVMQLSENSGVEIPGVREKLSDPNLRTKLIEAQQRLYLAYRLSAHEQEQVDPLSAEESARAKAELAAAMAGTPRDRRDFTGADLSGCDLHGIDLEGAFLEGANLRGANLAGARLRDAVLARANLEGAILQGANLERANLGRANLRRANLTEANLKEAILYESDLTGATLARARLDKAHTLHLVAEGTDFSGVQAEQLLFFRAKLNGATFRGARIHLSVFHECEAQRLDASSSDFSQSVFLMSNADGSNFNGSNLENFRIVLSSFERSDFSGSQMPGSNLRGAKLAGSKFSGVNLRRSDLSLADMRDVDFERGVAVECLVMDTNFENAKMAGSNLMLAIMHRAILRGADVSNSNLFCADLTGAIGDKRTSFSGANVKRALVAGVFHG